MADTPWKPNLAFLIRLRAYKYFSFVFFCPSAFFLNRRHRRQNEVEKNFQELILTTKRFPLDGVAQCLSLNFASAALITL